MILRAYVIKQWKVDVNPVDDEDHFVVIHGRASGLFAWLLNLMNIAATTSLMVSSNRLEFRRSSLAGEEHAIIPLQNLSSSYWGYQKPWVLALVIFFVCIDLLITTASFWRMESGIREGTFIVIMVLGVFLCAGIAIGYYLLNRTYVWGVIELSGKIRQIPFKRSVIEGQNITQESAAYASHVIQALIEAKSEK